MLFVGEKAVEPVTLDQFQDSAFADRGAADLSADVLLDDLIADVGEDHAPDVTAQLAPLVDLERRNPQRLLPHLPRLRVVAASHGAADIRLVTLGRCPGHQRFAMEYGPEGSHIVVLVAAGEDIVVQDHVARINLVAKKPDDLLARRLQGEGKHRDIFGLLEHVAIGVVEAGDEVARLVEDRRARGAQQGQAHFLGDRLEPPLHDRNQDRVDRHGHAPASLVPTSVKRQLPSLSTLNPKPGGTKIVVSAVSTTAGPAKRLPWVSASPS